MSWSAFPLPRIASPGKHPVDSFIVSYFPGGWSRPQRNLIGHRSSGAAASAVRQAVHLSPIGKTEDGRDVPHLYSLGSAYAGSGSRGFWHATAGRQLPGGEPETRPAPVDSIVHVPEEIRQVMAQIARASGRSERDLWTEAAGAWLSSHSFDDDPVPPAPSAALAIPATNRSWDMIDDILSALRRPPCIAAASVEELDDRAA